MLVSCFNIIIVTFAASITTANSHATQRQQSADVMSSSTLNPAGRCKLEQQHRWHCKVVLKSDLLNMYKRIVLPCRTAEACHAELSFIARCTRQLVSLCQVTAQAASALATAAAEYMSTSRTAQQAARLQLAVSSGRIAMLLLLVLLGALTGSSAVWSRCTTRRIRAAHQVQQLVSGLQQLVLLLPWPTQKQQRSRWFTAWTGPSMGWCVVSTAGKQHPLACVKCHRRSNAVQQWYGSC